MYVHIYIAFHLNPTLPHPALHHHHRADVRQISQFDRKKEMITRPVHRYFTTLYYLDIYMYIYICTYINIFKYTYKANFCRTIQ